jgi:hypothetical protein
VSEADEKAADRLCVACVELLAVDGASISLWHGGEAWGTFGASGTLSRQLDELQFTFGEGPCLDAVAESRPVLISDLRHPEAGRWAALTGAVLDMGIHGVFAMPVAVNGSNVGALDLFRRAPGALDDDQLRGGLIAAEIAGSQVRDLMQRSKARLADADGPAGDELAQLGRVEVYQATGMIMGQLDLTAAEALVRLRGYAFAHDMTASEVAWSIVERRLRLDDDDPDSSGNEGVIS